MAVAPLITFDDTLINWGDATVTWDGLQTTPVDTALPSNLTDLYDMLARIRPECPGCPTDLIRLTLIDVIREFCQQTRAWVHEVDFETVLQFVSDYDIELPHSSAYPIAIECLTVDGMPSVFKPTDWLDRHCTNWRKREGDDFSCFTHITPKVITFPCVPTKNGTVGGMAYRVSLKPAHNAEVIDTALAEEWIEAWSDGTKARLKAMPRKLWTDVARAGQLEQQYRVARTRARIRSMRSYGNSDDRWVGPRSFG